MSAKPKIQGIFAPIPTPFNPDEEIAFDQLQRNLGWWSETKLAGVVVLGSNGEFAYLTPEEKIKLVAEVKANWPADKMVIAGTGCETTRETIKLSRQAADLGVDACLILTPHYYKGSMTPAALKRYFWEVADACPVPVMLYNMPRNTGLNLASQLVIEIAKHPNIAGVKDSGGDIVQISEIAAGTDDTFSVFAGSGSFLLTTLLMGGVGGTLAVANVMPDQCAEIVELFHAGKLDEARELQRLILEPNRAVTGRWGIAGLKAALELMGKYGGPLRRPLLPLADAERAELAKVLATAGVSLA
jgi:4-hydroxy-2-oxoglutarate aldolase